MLAVARKKMSAQSTVIRGTDETDGPTPGPQAHTGVKVKNFFLKSSLESDLEKYFGANLEIVLLKILSCLDCTLIRLDLISISLIR